MAYSTSPPPPPPPTGTVNSRLGSIRTYLLIAFIFSILLMIVWLVAGIFYLIGFAATAVFSPVAALVLLIPGIIFLIFILPSVLVFFRVWKMYKAVNAGDIATLKATTSIGWAIVGLIFVGVITGIMLILADGPIKQL